MAEAALDGTVVDDHVCIRMNVRSLAIVDMKKKLVPAIANANAAETEDEES